MTLRRAPELKRLLDEQLDSHEVLELDLSQVTEIDSAGVQLLLLTKQTAQTEQKQLQLVGPSAAVIEVFELLNLCGHFGLPSAQSSHGQDLS